MKVRKHAHHIPHGFTLGGMFLLTIIGFVLFSYDENFQSALAIAAAGGYFAWGIVHHSIHKDLTVGVVLEYLAVSLLGLVIVMSLLTN